MLTPLHRGFPARLEPRTHQPPSITGLTSAGSGGREKALCKELWGGRGLGKALSDLGKTLGACARGQGNHLGGVCAVGKGRGGGAPARALL